MVLLLLVGIGSKLTQGICIGITNAKKKEKNLTVVVYKRGRGINSIGTSLEEKCAWVGLLIENDYLVPFFHVSERASPIVGVCKKAPP